ncbi:MAG: argininosuccinate lyase [Actinomycetota bacterium]
MGPADQEVGADEQVSVTWSGRFERGPHPSMFAFTQSLDIDIRLLPYDLAATKAHARTLVAAGLLDPSDVARVDEVCADIESRHEHGEPFGATQDEDVHSLVERILTEQLGDVGARIHAGRSRNDLVATDLRLWCRDASASLVDATAELVESIAAFAEGQVDTLVPGYTHLQRAQPVSVAFVMLAHGFALTRDATRFRAAYESADVSALGAGALAGTTLPLDARVAATELGFSGVFDNAMDAVSDRDFACELVYAAAMCCLHLSRLAEEVVLWTSAEFGFARLADDWSTGSSMMPQKRNPDVAELIRGRAAAAVGDLTGLLGLLKGLPLAYNRDLQEDKAIVFRAVDRADGCIRAMDGLLGAIRFDKDAMARAAAGAGSWATDLAERLVNRGVPFRHAHRAVGETVAALEQQGSDLADADPQEISSHHPELTVEDRAVADPRLGLASRRSHGGPAPERVAEQVAALRAAVARVRAS